MMRPTVLFLLAGVLAAPTPVDTKPESSIAGTVSDAGTGAPLPDVNVYVNQNSRDEIETKTDS
jgi:hypothetical protein